MKLSICIPMYNESEIVADTARQLTERMESFCDSNPGYTYEIIFSDDGSVDNTLELIPDFHELKYGEIIKTGYKENKGKGAAVKNAVKHSSGEFVMYTDCDLAYGTEVICDAFLHFSNCSSNVLVGSRSIHPSGYNGYTFIRKIASKTYLKILAVYAGFNLSDSQCGFKFFDGDLARKIFDQCQTNGWSFDFEILMLAKKEGAVMEEYPVQVVNHRESKIHVFSDSIKMLKELRIIKKRLL